MTARNQAALDFLLSRRSYPAKMMTDGPVPDDAELELILTAAARTPDHGKLEPWRFVVARAPALRRIADSMDALGPRIGIEPEKVAKSTMLYRTSQLAVVVVSSPKPSEKVPHIEQVLSSGAVCVALVNAATAAGWGANWLSGWASHDQDFARDTLGLTPQETIAGIIHLGTPGPAAPERPRPDLSKLVTWLDK